MLTPSGTAGANGWFTSDVTVKTTGTDDISGPVSCSPDQTLTSETAGTAVNGSCTDQAGLSTDASPISVKIDKTAPAATLTPSGTAGANGWFTSDVTVKTSGTDDISGPVVCSPDQTLTSETAGTAVDGSCTDQAGLSTDASPISVKIDKTAPTVSLAGGPTNNGVYYFGFVPAAPTCTPSDALSGLDGSCSVSGYSTAIGSQSVTATAKDLAGNVASATNTYSVLGWTSKGFYQPVDMSTSIQLVYNTVKGGSTVPLKFELFAGLTELTDTAWVDKLVGGLVACNTNAVNDDIELTVPGSTSLRYDTVAGQFIYNWKTPTNLTGKCYSVTALLKDGSSVQVAYFKFK